MAFPDLVLTHAAFLTLDDGDQVAGAIAVTDGIITAVGTDEEIRASAGPGTEVVDLEGATVVPGFVDAHSHVSIGAPYIRCADLQTPPVDGVTTVDGGTIASHLGTQTPDGVLWEQAWMPLVALGFLDHGRAELDEMLGEYARWAMTTVQDGATSWPQTQQVRDRASETDPPVDVRSLVTWSDLPLAVDAGLVDTTVGGHTAQGGKLIVDGSPQGRTALVSGESAAVPPARSTGTASRPWTPTPSTAWSNAPTATASRCSPTSTATRPSTPSSTATALPWRRARSRSCPPCRSTPR